MAPLPAPEGGHTGGLGAELPSGAKGAVSVIVPTRNEARRLAPCLAGLEAQGAALREVIVVDSDSSDGTRQMVDDVARRDRRFRVEPDPPLPPGWVGKVWALQHGLGVALVIESQSLGFIAEGPGMHHQSQLVGIRDEAGGGL